VLDFVSHAGVEGCSISGKKNDRVVNEDLLKDEIVSEQLTRYCKWLPINLISIFSELISDCNSVLHC